MLLIQKLTTEKFQIIMSENDDIILRHKTGSFLKVPYPIDTISEQSEEETLKTFEEELKWTKKLTSEIIKKSIEELTFNLPFDFEFFFDLKELIDYKEDDIYRFENQLNVFLFKVIKSINI